MGCGENENDAQIAIIKPRWENPYLARCRDFPGRLFAFERESEDRLALRTLVASYSRIYCEIGSGSGRHLLELARRNPDVLVVGFELRFKRAVRTIEKALDAGIANAVVCRMRAELLSELFPKRSLAGIFINYPDPWAKSRWHKHRILSEAFLKQLAELLLLEGVLSVKTDHAEYFAYFQEELAKLPQFKIVEQTCDLKHSEYFLLNIPTEFEALFLSQGLPLCYAKCVLR